MLLVERLQAGEYGFRATEPRAMGAPGPARGRRGRDGDEGVRRPWVPVTVEEGQVTELTLTMPAVGVLLGRVLEQGTPLAGAALSVFEDDDAAEGVRDDVVVEGFEAFTATALATTGEDGTFRLDDLPVGAYRLRVRHSSRAMPSTVRFEMEEGENELTVTLEITSVAGTIRDADGRSLAGVTVRALRADRSSRSRLRLGEALGLVTPGKGEVETDSQGAYVLRGVTVEQELVVRATAPGWCLTDSEPFALHAGEAKEGLDLRLERAGTLEVKVLGGRPFQRVRLRRGEEAEERALGEVARPAGELRSPGATRIELTRRGVATFDDLEPGPWTVTAGGVEQEVLIAAGETCTVELDLGEE